MSNNSSLSKSTLLIFRALAGVLRMLFVLSRQLSPRIAGIGWATDFVKLVLGWVGGLLMGGLKGY